MNAEGMAVRTAVQMRVLVLAIAAVAVSATVLGVLQYRSLAELETRTRTTFQDDLVRAAQAIARQVEEEVRTAGAEALGSFRREDPHQDVRALGGRFQALRRRQPEIEEVFLFALDDPNGISAVFSNAAGAERFT